jgi:LPPG:FO 2-phospho-L-lactate transferase
VSGIDDGEDGGVVLLSGGFGGARLVPALVAALGEGCLTVVANVGDDLTLHELRICPDVDSILYALSGLWDADRGWGRRDETFQVDLALAALGVQRWFSLGDRDLALHLWRAERLGQGWSLTEATTGLAAALGLRGATVLPASDEPAETRIVTADGRTLPFQEWYVREHAEPKVAMTRLAGGSPSDSVRAALRSARAVVIGPSNPISSVGAILALDGMMDLVAGIPTRVAVSPVVAGRPCRDPGILHHARARENLLVARGLRDRPSDIATLYAGLVQDFVIDASDRTASAAVEALGMRAVVAELLDPSSLAATLAGLVGPPSSR